MNILDGFQAVVTAVIEQLGLFVQVPSFILGLGLVVAAVVMIRKSNGQTSILFRVIAGIALVVGLPILLTTFGVGTTDAILWAIIALVGVGIWLAAATGKVITIIGIVVVILAIGGLVRVTNANPEGSIVADNLRTFSGWSETVLSGVLG